MFVRRKNSTRKFLHVHNCSLLSTTLPKDLVLVTDVDAAFCEGYEMCYQCNPLRKKYQAEAQSIRAFCQKNGLSYEVHSRYIEVSTIWSQWAIVLADNRCQTMLFHKNTLDPEEGNGFLPGYHNQKESFSSLLPYFQYILSHDTDRFCAPLPPPPEKESSKKAPSKKEPPKIGTKRYRQQLKRKKKRAKYRSVQKVYTLIDNLHPEKKPLKKSIRTG